MNLAGLFKRIDLIEARAKQKQRADELNQILACITFEHRAGYELEVSASYGTDFYLKVVRNVPDSRDGKMIQVNNSAMLKGNVTNDEFIKRVFKQVGQFEAHEFAESFRYKDKHAYFPHHADKGHALYGQGEMLNRQILDVWADITNDVSDWTIASRYFGRAFVKLPVVSHYIAFDKAMTHKLRSHWFLLKHNADKLQRRLIMRVNVLRAKIDLAIKAFQSDPMDMPVSQPVTMTFTLNVETGEIKPQDSQNSSKAS